MSLGRLSNLVSLDLGYNALTGEIPSELAGLANLENLILSDNELTGEIPRELGALARLKALWMQDNDLEGTIPFELGQLLRLSGLGLDGNRLTGDIPRELGSLSELVRLDVSGNELTGPIPEELGGLVAISSLDVEHNLLSGPLPESLTNLAAVERLHFEGQALCAPVDADFQAWLGAIDDAAGPNCISFTRTIADQTYTVRIEIANLTLPLAAGGEAPLTYALWPALPTGLVFDAGRRVLSGTPTEVFDKTEYLYEVSDPNGVAGALTFSIDVTGPTSAESAGPELPATIALRGNYPNPFNPSTTVVFDLPATAMVSVRIIDLLGRTVRIVGPHAMAAGWNRSLELNLEYAPSGSYLYQLRAETDAGMLVGTRKMMLRR